MTMPAGLPALIVAGLRALRDLTRLPPEVTTGYLEAALRDGAARYRTPIGPDLAETGPTDPTATAAAAVLTACAHLGTRDYVDAYLALLAAYDALPHSSRTPPDQAQRRAGTAAASHQQALDERTAVEQAVGIIVETDGVSVVAARRALHREAERLGVPIGGLADAVVAGRADPALLADDEPTDHEQTVES